MGKQFPLQKAGKLSAPRNVSEDEDDPLEVPLKDIIEFIQSLIMTILSPNWFPKILYKHKLFFELKYIYLLPSPTTMPNT